LQYWYIQAADGGTGRKARQAVYMQRNIKARSRNHFCGGKALSIKYLNMSAFLPYLSSMQSACAILSSVAGLAAPRFFALCHK